MSYFSLISSDVMSIIRDLDVFSYIQIFLYIAWLVIIGLPLKAVYLGDDIAFATYVYIATALGVVLLVAVPASVGFEAQTPQQYSFLIAVLAILSAMRWITSRISEDYQKAKNLEISATLEKK